MNSDFLFGLTLGIAATLALEFAWVAWKMRNWRPDK
jgi:hypothetical protein